MTGQDRTGQDRDRDRDKISRNPGNLEKARESPEKDTAPQNARETDSAAKVLGQETKENALSREILEKPNPMPVRQ